MRLFFQVIGALALAMMLGCRAQTLEQDQADMRASLLKLYKQQVMENLVRTARMEPVIEIDFTTVTGTITELGKGTLGYGRESDTQSKSKMNSYLVKTTPSITGEQDITTQLTITGNPVTDPSVYTAYEEFIWGPNGAPIHGCPAALSRGKGVPPSTQPILPPVGVPATEPTTQPTTQPTPPYGIHVSANPLWVFSVDATPPAPPPPANDPRIDQGKLYVSDTEMPEGTYAEQIQYAGKYYYIPNESAGQFFSLYKWVVLHRQPAAGQQPASSTAPNVVHQLELFRLNQLNLQ